MIQIHHGDCLDVLRGLPDNAVNAVITDPPYSERTHSGHDATTNGHAGSGSDDADRKPLAYSHWTQADIEVVIPELCRVSSGWVVVMTDHMLVLQIQSAMETAGRYAFAPLPFLDPGSRCRLGGDGPSCWAIWIVVCRTAAQARWGTLPGGYIAGKGWRDRRYVGGKPIQLMRALVNDYSRPGDTVLDPFLGSGTTGHAAVELGRSFIGVEQDADAFAMAKQRIESARHKPGLSFTRTKKRKDRGLL